MDEAAKTRVREFVETWIRCDEMTDDNWRVRLTEPPNGNHLVYLTRTYTLQATAAQERVAFIQHFACLAEWALALLPPPERFAKLTLDCVVRVFVAACVQSVLSGDVYFTSVETNGQYCLRLGSTANKTEADAYLSDFRKGLAAFIRELYYKSPDLNLEKGLSLTGYKGFWLPDADVAALDLVQDERTKIGSGDAGRSSYERASLIAKHLQVAAAYASVAHNMEAHREDLFKLEIARVVALSLNALVAYGQRSKMEGTMFSARGRCRFIGDSNEVYAVSAEVLRALLAHLSQQAGTPVEMPEYTALDVVGIVQSGRIVGIEPSARVSAAVEHGWLLAEPALR